MTASLPYRNRTYSHVPAMPPTMLAMTYTPNGGGGTSVAKNRATNPAPTMADTACTRMSIPGAYHG